MMDGHRIAWMMDELRSVWILDKHRTAFLRSKTRRFTENKGPLSGTVNNWFTLVCDDQPMKRRAREHLRWL